MLGILLKIAYEMLLIAGMMLIFLGMSCLFEILLENNSKED